MSYSAYITRDEFYPFLRGSGGSSISLDEWLALVEADTTLSLNNDGLVATWTGSPTPFRYCVEYADIAHDDPSSAVLEKMVALSTTISAFVRGGDGEFWLTGSEFEWPDHPDFQLSD